MNAPSITRKRAPCLCGYTDFVFHVLLYEPEIPPNTGNAVRLCANTGARLHLIEPLGFALDDARMRRAGLDYRERARVHVHPGLPECLEAIRPRRVFGLSTRGERSVFEPAFDADDAFLFGPETRGLPGRVLASLGRGRVLRLPMRPRIRSLNLSNAIAVTVYEAWRQNGFAGAGRNEGEPDRATPGE